MNIKNSWIIATKDFEIFRKKKQILLSLLIFPLILGVGFPLLILGVIDEPSIKIEEIVILINTLSLIYIMMPSFIPPTLASYSIVGEKTEKTLETLLASPITDDELLFGKIIAAFVPSISIIYLSSLIFMFLINIFTYSRLNYFFFPNWDIGIVLLLIVPFITFLSVEVNVLISSRSSDIRSASQLGVLSMFPFIGLYMLFQRELIGINLFNLLGIAVFLLVIAIFLFIIIRSIFNREKILTKWT
ncbi:MAG: ABC transporter permease subunit [Methanobrevibacter sp.]|nr:ABC transporter permease subunit [Methanobrevibacter sp.]